MMEDGEMRKGRTEGVVRSSSIPRGPWQKSVSSAPPPFCLPSAPILTSLAGLPLSLVPPRFTAARMQFS